MIKIYIQQYCLIYYGILNLKNYIRNSGYLAKIIYINIKNIKKDLKHSLVDFIYY